MEPSVRLRLKTRGGETETWNEHGDTNIGTAKLTKCARPYGKCHLGTRPVPTSCSSSPTRNGAIR